MTRLSVDVWSDIACPWCYVGKRRLESALAKFEHAGQVDVVWHAFELDPAAPKMSDAQVSYAERLAKKYRMSVSDAQKRLDEMTELGKTESIAFHFERAQSGNTFEAHRLLQLALRNGLQLELEEAFFRAYFAEGIAMSDTSALQRIATGVGLAEELVATTLATDAYSAEVRADEQAAHALGVRGVPFFVIGQRYGLSGAQPAEVLLEALKRAWREGPQENPAPDEGAVCGPEGCE